MHRHAYQGKKLQRDRDQRRALLRGLVTSLVMYESIETTLAKAKAAAPYFERLVTKAKKGDLHSQRQTRSFLLTEVAAQKLMQELAPAFKQRTGGYTRVIKAGTRQGDSAPLARLSLVLPVKSTKSDVEMKEVKEAKPAAKAKPAKEKANA